VSKREFFSHQLNRAVHARIPGDIVTMMALHGWNAFGIYEVVQEEKKREKEKRRAEREQSGGERKMKRLRQWFGRLLYWLNRAKE
jgi:hypothetical protein